MRSDNVRKLFFGLCAQRNFRSACADAQSDRERSVVALYIAKDPRFLLADSENSDPTARTRRLI